MGLKADSTFSSRDVTRNPHYREFSVAMRRRRCHQTSTSVSVAHASADAVQHFDGLIRLESRGNLRSRAGALKSETEFAFQTVASVLACSSGPQASGMPS